MIYRRTRHYAHNSTYISLFRNYMCIQQAWLIILPKKLTFRKPSIPRNSRKSRNFRRSECTEFSTSWKNGDNCEDLLAAPDPEIYFEFDMCVWDFKSEGQSQNFLITKTICGFIVPFIIISVSYILIAFRTLAQMTSNWPPNDLRWRQMITNDLELSKNRTAKLKHHREARCSKTNSIILIVVTSFFITWLPNHALNMYMVLKPPSEWSPKVFRLNPFTQVSFKPVPNWTRTRPN